MISSFAYPAQAVISSCTASVDRHTVTPDTTADYQFTISNTDSTKTVVWFEVQVPSGNFQIIQVVTPGWNRTVQSNLTRATGGTITPGGTYSFTVTAYSSNVQAPAANWLVKVSDDANGASPTSCTGNLGTEISGQPPDTTPPEISNVALSNLSATGITISWVTNEPANSRVYYGLTSSYGSTATDTTLTTNHKITLTGLTPETGYHYQIESQDAAGNTMTTDDGTFLTAVAPPPAPPPPPPTFLPVPVPIPASPLPPAPGLEPPAPEPKETVPPTISLTTKIAGPVKEVPTITGTASDNEGLAKIDYSTDGGKSWLSVTTTRVARGRAIAFEFRPEHLDDGNYEIIARATDTSGNRATSQTLPLVIDRLPPIVGGNLLTVGPQVLLPDREGNIVAVQGIDQKITLSAVGGPTTITIIATPAKGKERHTFSLTKSSQTGLWSGILSFQEKGHYTLVVDSVDGAGNRRERTLNSVRVVPSGVAQRKGSSEGVEARVTLFFQEPLAKVWTVWDGAPYGQQNPVQTGRNGVFQFLVPPGTYYLRAEAQGFRPLVSQIFRVEEPTILAPQLLLTPNLLGLPLPTLRTATIDLRPAEEGQGATKNVLLETPLPLITLPTTAGSSLATIDLRGKPTVLTFLSSWSPATAEQLPALAALQVNQDLGITPVFAQESVAKVKTIVGRAGYTLTSAVDSDGSIVEQFALRSIPTHYFVNRRGIIKKVIVGVLSEEELLRELTGL